MLKLRYWVRLTVAFVGRFKGILFIGLVAGVFLFVAARFVTPTIIGGKEEVVGMTGRYHTEELPDNILGEIGDGLTEVNCEGLIKGALAESWESDDDGKTWVFHLKKGMRWHDGSEVTTETIDYVFDDVRVEKPDRYTMVFILDHRFAPFPIVVEKPVFKKGLLGTGEWKVNKLELKRGYVERIVLNNDAGEKKVIKFFPTEEQTKLAFKLGKISIINDLINPKPFDAWSGVEMIEELCKERYVGIFFNNQDQLFNDNKPLRQALAYAIDKEYFGERAVGPISPKSWAFNPQIKDYQYDAEHAMELLKEAGGEGNEVKLVTTPALLEVAEKVSEDWKKVGVETRVLVSAVLPQEYQAFLAIYDVPNDPDQYATWHSTQSETNISKYSNPRVDKLLEDGRLEMDQEARKKIYWDFQRFLLEDAPAIFLYHPISYTIKRR